MDYGANEWLSDIQNQTRRLTELTNSLIMLARMEEQPAAEKIDFPLSDIAQEAAESFLALAKTQNKTLECRIQPMISMCGDEKALRQLITILLDNAIKYYPGGRKHFSDTGETEKQHPAECIQYNTVSLKKKPGTSV